MSSKRNAYGGDQESSNRKLSVEKSDDDIIGSYVVDDGELTKGTASFTATPAPAAPASQLPRSASKKEFASLAREQPTSQASASPSLGNSQAAFAGGMGTYPPVEPMMVSEVRDIEKMFQQLKENQSTLRYLRERVKTVTSSAEGARVESQIDDRTNDSRVLMEDCRKRIKHLYEKGKKPKTPEEQMRKNQQLTLAKQLYTIAQEFQAMQLNLKTDVVDKLRRQYKIVRPGANASEVEDYISNASMYNSQANNVFQQAALNGKEQALFAFQEAKIQQTQLEKLNKAIEEMLNLFQEMQLLIDVQGEQVNEIQINSESVVVNMQDASKEMSKAIAHRISARKRAWCIFVLVLVALGVLAIIIYFSIPKNK